MSILANVPKVFCRPIEDEDLEAVADLLAKGFVERPRTYWSRGFARMRTRRLPPDCLRYGMMLDWCGKPVGVMLAFFSMPIEQAGNPGLRCNLSSWYVDPAYGAHVGSLVLNCLRRRAVTYTNNSAARHTLATVEAVKFLRYTTAYFFAVPVLTRAPGGGRVHAIRSARDADRFAGLPERDLLIDHALMGCLSLVVERDGEMSPFVFQRFSARSGSLPLPIHQLIYCRELEDLARLARPIGGYLLRRGIPFVVLDTDGTHPRGLVGFSRQQRSPKFYRGPNKPRLGDLAYSERVILGP